MQKSVVPAQLFHYSTNQTSLIMSHIKLSTGTSPMVLSKNMSCMYFPFILRSVVNRSSSLPNLRGSEGNWVRMYPERAVWHLSCINSTDLGSEMPMVPSKGDWDIQLGYILYLPKIFIAWWTSLGENKWYNWYYPKLRILPDIHKKLVKFWTTFMQHIFIEICLIPPNIDTLHHYHLRIVAFKYLTLLVLLLFDLYIQWLQNWYTIPLPCGIILSSSYYFWVAYTKITFINIMVEIFIIVDGCILYQISNNCPKLKKA